MANTKENTKDWSAADVKAQPDSVCFIRNHKGEVLGIFRGVYYVCHPCKDEKAVERVRFFFCKERSALEFSVKGFVDEVLCARPTSACLIELDGQVVYIPGRLIYDVVRCSLS